MSAVVSRSRVARATVYRRYATREALIEAALSHVKGRAPYPLTGDIVADIETGARTAAAVLAEPAFQRYLPLFVAEALRGPAAARSIMTRLAPNHAGVAREFLAGAAAAGLRTDIDPTLVSDVVIGTMIMRLLSTGRPPDDTAVRQLVDVMLRGLAEPAASESAPAEAAAG